MRIVVIGAGGHGKVVVDAALSSGKHTVVGIVDDDDSLVGTALFHIPVVASIKDLNGVEGFIVAIGDNRTRKRKYDLLLNAGYEPITIVHPSSIVSPRSRVGKGCVLLANAVVTPDTTIGDNVVLYTSCTVDHDCIVSSHSYISPGCNVCGKVHIGTGAMLGTGAVVLPGISIGEWSVVGAGAVVIADVADNATVVGVPAGAIKHREQK